MSDSLKKLIEESEQPLSGEIGGFVDAVRDKTIQLQLATARVSDDVLNQDKVIFSFETSRGHYEFPYSPKLNGALVRMGVKMATAEAEAVRMGKLLLDNLRYSDAQFGKHYTDAVLWYVIEERFGHVGLLRHALDDLTHYPASEGESKLACEKYLRDCIAGAGNSIVIELRWPDPPAFGILAGAVYYMLDQRHHISARGVLFPKS